MASTSNDTQSFVEKFYEKFVLINLSVTTIDTLKKLKTFNKLLSSLKAAQSGEPDPNSDARYYKSRETYYAVLLHLELEIRAGKKMAEYIDKYPRIRDMFINAMEDRMDRWEEISRTHVANLPDEELIRYILNLSNFELIITLVEALPRLQQLLHDNTTIVTKLAERFAISLSYKIGPLDRIYDSSWDRLLHGYDTKHLNHRSVQNYLNNPVACFIVAANNHNDGLFMYFLDSLSPDPTSFDDVLVNMAKVSNPNSFSLVERRMSLLGLIPGSSYDDDLEKRRGLLEYITDVDERNEILEIINNWDSRKMFHQDLISTFNEPGSARNPKVIEDITHLIRTQSQP